jgi:hypothetical protein
MAREAPARTRSQTRDAQDSARLAGRRRCRCVHRDRPHALGWTSRPASAPEPGQLAPRVFSRTRGMLRGAHHRRLAKAGARDGASLRLEMLPEAAPAVVPRVPASKILRQVVPGQSCPGAIQHCLDNQASTAHWRPARARFPGGEEGGKVRPGLIRKQETYRPQVSFPPSSIC